VGQGTRGARGARKAVYTGGGRGHRASRYLLSGFARCAVCGGGFSAHAREHGERIVQFYGCTSFWKRGATVCGNNLVGRMELLDAEVLATLQDDVLRPTVVERAIAMVLEDLTPAGHAHHRHALGQELAAVDAECERLADAIMRVVVWSGRVANSGYVPRGIRRVVHAHRPMVRRTTGRIIFSSGIALLPSSGGPHEHAVDPTEDIELLVEHATPPVLHSVELRPPHATAMNSGCRTRHASCPISCLGAGLQPCPLVL
jgi:hypothetical protein